MRRILMISALCTILNTSIFAHGGHTIFESHLWHYLLSPGHVMPAVLTLLVILLTIWRKKQLLEVVGLRSHGHHQK